MQHYWDRVTARLSELGCLAEMNILSGATETELQDLESHLGVQLPEALRAFLKVHNGQGEGAGIAFGFQLLSTQEIRQQWDNWRSIDEEEMNRDCADFMGSSPEGFIKAMYCNKKWIPITHDWGGNHIGIDFDPDEKGHNGQVIAFGRDEDIKRVIAGGFPAFVVQLVEFLERATWQGEYLEST